MNRHVGRLAVTSVALGWLGLAWIGIGLAESGPDAAVAGAPDSVDALVAEGHFAHGRARFLVKLNGDAELTDSVEGPGETFPLAGLRGLEAKRSLTDVEVFPNARVIAVEANQAVAEALARTPGVTAIFPDRVRRLPATDVTPLRDFQRAVPSSPLDALPWNLNAVAARQAWTAEGVSGEGAVVAALDTGADWLHPDLLGAYRGRDGDHDYDWYDVTRPGSDRPFDPHGHGTQVLGIIAGRRDGLSPGVAPGAEWMAVRVFNNQGTSRDSWLLRAGEWILAPTDLQGRHPRPDLRPSVVNASWVLENGADPLYRDMVQAWRAAGIVPVFAAGNAEGRADPHGGILAPASYPEAIGVGASTRSGAPWVASLTGPGFYQPDKPDLLAPGVDVVTTAPGGGHASATGTSMAVPHVSGAAAVLLGLDPAASVADVERILEWSAVSEGGRESGRAGPPLRHLSVGAAAALMARSGAVEGHVTVLRDPGDAGHGGGEARPGGGGAWPIEVVATDSRGREARQPIGAEGRYRLVLPAGAWTVVLAVGEPIGVARQVTIEPGQALQLDLLVDARSSGGGSGGRLEGRVITTSGVPVAGAEVMASRSGARVATVADAQGRYGLGLPAGAWRLEARHPAVRATGAQWQITAGAVHRRDLVVEWSPSVVLVDADAYQDERMFPYLERPLRSQGWTVDSVAVADPRQPVEPLIADADVIVWAHRSGSPGRMDVLRDDFGVTTALSAALDRGQGLVVTGPEVGSNDAGEGPFGRRLAPDFYRQVLGAEWLGEVGAAVSVFGHGSLSGLDLALGHWSALRSTKAPDRVAPGRPDTEVLTRYATGEAAGDAAGLLTLGPEGRRGYLAFGLETAGPENDRGAWASVLVEAVAPTPPRVILVPSLTLAPSRPRRRAGVSEAITLTAALQNLRPATAVTGRLAIDLPVDFRAAPEDLTVSHGGVEWRTGGLSWSGVITSGHPVSLSLPGRINVPGLAAFGATSEPGGESVAAAIHVDGPNLAVDTGGPGRPFKPGDHRVVGLTVTNLGAAPASPATVELTPPVGFRVEPAAGWIREIPAGAELPITATVWADAEVSPGRHSLVWQLDDGAAPRRPVTASDTVEILAPEPRLEVTAEPERAPAGGVVAIRADLRNVGTDRGEFRLTALFPPHVHAISGTASASAGTVNETSAGLEWSVALSRGESATLHADVQISRTVAHNERLGLPMAVEADPGGGAAQAETVIRADPVALELDLAGPSQLPAGGAAVFSASITADSLASVTDAELTLRPSPGVRLEGLPDGFSPAGEAYIWRGTVGPEAPRDHSFTAVLAPGLAVGSRPYLVVEVGTPGWVHATRRAHIRVTADDFTGSRKRFVPAVAEPGDTVGVVLRAANGGKASARVAVTDALPPGLRLLAGSLWASAGSAPEYDPQERTVLWVGDIPAGGAVEIEFEVVYEADLPVRNTMVISNRTDTWVAAGAVLRPRADRVFLPAASAGAMDAGGHGTRGD